MITEPQIGLRHERHTVGVIDMAGTMDIEVGYMVGAPLEGDERVRSGVLPEGR